MAKLKLATISGRNSAASAGWPGESQRGGRGHPADGVPPILTRSRFANATLGGCGDGLGTRRPARTCAAARGRDRPRRAGRSQPRMHASDAMGRARVLVDVAGRPVMG